MSDPSDPPMVNHRRQESIDRESGPFGFNVSSSAPDEQAEVTAKIPSKKNADLNSFLNMF